MAFAGGFVNPGPARPPIDYWDPAPDDRDESGGKIFFYGEGPLFSANPWDVVALNGERLPGICKIKAEPTIRFDKKKPPGSDGLTITGQGYLPGPVQIEILLWTAAQWTIFQDIADKIWIKPKRGGVIKAIDISHPATDLWKIRSIVIEGVSVPEDGPQPQSKIIRIKAVEFLPTDAKTKTNTVKAAGKVALDKHVARAKNAGGDDPGQTDTSPRGAKKDTSPSAT